MMDKISVITVVYNGAEYLEDTIKSVINQSYENVEYLIIDGGSKDGTVEIIKKYKDYLAYWISEPDDGLYFAMNKGIDKATGNWIIFMNCGDNFYDKDVLSRVFTRDIPKSIDAILGGAFVRCYWSDFYINARKEKDIWKSFVHQCLFTRRELNIKYKFDTKFVTASDYNFVYTIFSKGHKFLSIKLIVSSILYINSGFTSKYEILNKVETLRAIKMHSKDTLSFVHHYSYHYFALIRKRLAVIINRINPDLILRIRKIRDKYKRFEE